MPPAATSTQQLWFLNQLVTVRVRHDEGEDGISVLESLAPHGNSPPLHVHQTEDEIFHVLEGQLRVRAGDTEVRIGAGETILGPKAVPHTYRVESHEGARWLLITRRGDFERFVRAPPPRGAARAARGPRAAHARTGQSARGGRPGARDRVRRTTARLTPTSRPLCPWM